MKSFHILSIGAGAIGCYIGGALHRAGHSVTFLEKSDIAEQLAHQGILIRDKTDSYKIENPHMVTSISQAIQSSHYDLALFALKSFDTKKFLESLPPLSTPFPPVLCLQNGVENEDVLRNTLGHQNVISATVTSAISKLSLNEILIEKQRGVGIADEHPLAPELVTAMKEAGLNARLYPNPAAMKWSKMLTNLLANASSAILNMTPMEIFSHPLSYQIEVMQIKEALQVMRRLHIPVTDLPATPVRLLLAAIHRLPMRVSQPLLIQFVGKGRGNKMPSFYIDLQAGRQESEVEYLNGAVVRFGAQVNVPTPVNHFLNETLLSIVRGSLSRQTYDHAPEKLFSAIRLNL